MPDKFDAYRQTTYVVDGPDGEIRMRIGEHSRELDASVRATSARDGAPDSRPWAFVTAWNPDGEAHPRAENEARMLAMTGWLDDNGYRYFSGRGEPDLGAWTPEESALILDMTHDDAVTLARAWSQEAIVVGELDKPARLVDCR